MVGKSVSLLLASALFLSGCGASATVGGRIRMMPDPQKIDPKTVTVIHVGQVIFPPEEEKEILVHEQKRMEEAAKPNNPSIEMDNEKEAKKKKTRDELYDYIALNQQVLSSSLKRDLWNNGVTAITKQELEAHQELYQDAPKILLQVNFSLAQSGKKKPYIMTVGLGEHQLETEVQLFDLRDKPPLECLKFEVSAGGWKPGISLAPSLALYKGREKKESQDAELTARKITPMVVEYFVDQHWLESSFAPDYSGNEEVKKSLFERILGK